MYIPQGNSLLSGTIRSNLLLAESTSALDAATEAQLLSNLHDRLHGKKTILFISHREAVVKCADATVVVSGSD